MKKHFLLIYLLFYAFCGTAQDVNVTGIITDMHNEAVPYPSIVFVSLNDSLSVFGAVGNEDGSFAIRVSKQVYTAEVFVVGIIPIKLNIDLTDVEKALDLGLIQVDTRIDLDEMIVKAEALDYKLELDKKVYYISRDMLAKGGTLNDIMQNLPSVQLEVDGAISLRGNANVRILIDGKPSGFTNTVSLLSTIPANTVQRVEVITNPSSKYMAEGSGGMINIVLKKGLKKRLSKSIETYAGYRANIGLNTNLSKGTENASWYINSGIGYSEPKATYEMSLQNSLDLIKESHQYSERILNQFYLLTNVGGQKNLNENNTLSADITYRLASAKNPTTIIYEDIDTWDTFSSSQRIDIETIKDHFFQANIHYQLKMNNSAELSLKFNTQFSKERDVSTIEENIVQPEELIVSKDYMPKVFNNNKQIISLDYTLPLKNKAQIELGLQNRATKTDSDCSMESFMNEEWNLVPEVSNQFDYRESVTAFYGQFAKSYTKLKFQIGLRGETTDIDIKSRSNNTSITRHYLDLFPSAFLSYEFNESNEIRYSISRRIGRPRGRQLMPFFSLTDNRNIFQGNPELAPFYSILMELAYKTNISNNFSMTPTLFYSKTTQATGYFLSAENIVIREESGPYFVSQAINLEDNTSLGIELGCAYTITKWLSMFCEFSFRKFRQTGAYQNVSLNSSGAVLYGRYHINFKFPKSFRFQIQNRFRNGNTLGQLTRKPVYRMDIGLSKVFNEKTSLTLNAKDIFDTWAFRMNRVGEGFTQKIVSQVRVPQLNVSFIYQVNQKKYKGKKGRQYDKL